MTDESNEYAFQGVWIPKSIWQATDITWMEKCLCAEIFNLDGKNGCFASDEYLAEKFGNTKASIANMLSKLRKLRYVETVSFDGRRRVMRITKEVRAGLTPELEQPKPSGESSLNRPVNSYRREIKAKNKADKKALSAAPAELDDFGDFSDFVEIDSLPEMPEPKLSSSVKPKMDAPTAEEIYQAYPKKVAKIKAIKAVQKLIDSKKIPAPELFEIVKNYAKAIAWKDQQFIPYMEAWINAGQYDDDPNAWKQPAPIHRQPANGKFIEKPLDQKNYDDHDF